MKSTIDACVAFDFKGQHHELCIHLNLDQQPALKAVLLAAYQLGAAGGQHG
ncbi:hypothetical protein MNBD_GAMMA20-674 [hydrothermal vent metagenome]|uniref:Uncharacterized protein n=1 Tax=hydrothermal vent metagenome TaxID=652676 RepID=A0A3B1AX91_9ZZZZ